MRACTKLNKIALLIKAYVLTLFGMFFYKLNLIDFALFLHHLQSFVNGKRELLENKTFFYDLLHFCFDFIERISKRLITVKVIIEAVVNSGADSKLCFGEKSLYCLSENMGSSMSECTLALFVIKCYKLDFAVVFNLCAKVLDLTVNFTYTNCLEKSRTKTFCNFHCRYTVFILTVVFS